jgi:hypothetical protein
MKGKIFLVLLITIMVGGYPAFAQQAQAESGKPPAAKEAVPEEKAVININLASDDEFNQALEKASDIELVDEETAKTEESGKTSNKKTGESGKAPNKGKGVQK